MKTKEDILIEHEVLIKERWNNGNSFPFPLNLTRDTNIKVTKEILSAMEEYGKQMYNQAIDDAVREAEVDYFMEEDICCHSVDTKSILKLKKL